LIEEIDWVDNHDNITYSYSAPLIVDSCLHSIPTRSNLNLPNTRDIFKEFLIMSIIEMCNNIHLDTKHRIICLYNVVLKVFKFKTNLGKINGLERFVKNRFINIYNNDDNMYFYSFSLLFGYRGIFESKRWCKMYS
jgi:hypothetical protein